MMASLYVSLKANESGKLRYEIASDRPPFCVKRASERTSASDTKLIS